MTMAFTKERATVLATMDKYYVVRIIHDQVYGVWDWKGDSWVEFNAPHWADSLLWYDANATKLPHAMRSF